MSPFDGTWSETNSAPIVCAGCFDFGKKEFDSQKTPYIKENISYVLVYPNPVKDRQILISYQFKDNLPVKITMYDLLGKPVQSKSLYPAKTHDAIGTALKFNHSITPGIYLVVVENGQERFVEKIIIQ